MSRTVLFLDRPLVVLLSSVGSDSVNGALLVLLGLSLVSFGLVVILVGLVWEPQVLFTRKGVMICLVAVVVSWSAIGGLPMLRTFGGVAALAASMAIATGLAAYTTIWLMEAPV